MSHTKIFIEYFERQFWGNTSGSSGPNSDPSLTPVLRKNLTNLLSKYHIKSILDAGCGDANVFKDIPLEGISYLGLECVDALTQLNRQMFVSSPNMHFKTQDIFSEALPKVDLIICRDVLHYLPNEYITQFLNNCSDSGSTFLLVTHNTYSQYSANCDTTVGIFRPVNLSQSPFCLNPIETIKEDVFAKEMALYYADLDI